MAFQGKVLQTAPPPDGAKHAVYRRQRGRITRGTNAGRRIKSRYFIQDPKELVT